MSQRSVLTIGPCCPTSSSSSSEGEDDEEDDNIDIHSNDTITNEDIDAHYENTNDDDDDAEQQQRRLPTEDEDKDAGKVAAATEKKQIITIDDDDGDDLDDTGGGRGDDDARNEAVLPLPSPEQQRIIQAVQQGQCVTVRACAGSGKTTCMLQVAQQVLLAQPHRNVVIITYNRSLADDCKVRIAKLHHLQHRIHCYTIHGLVSRYAGQICNDDNKLLQTLQVWDRNNGITFNTHGRSSVPPPLDLVMLDEAQDIRPLFHKLLSHIFNTTVHETNKTNSSNNNDDDGDRKTNQKNGSMQLCLVGDPKQLLYNFATYGSDKASSKFFLEPEHYWGKFTANRIWTQLPLSVSYRLTPNIATFCNVFWGTTMTGGNTQSPNLPVEYYIKYPYPDTRNLDNPEKLSTRFLANIIDEHGPENVLFLAQSVKSERLPVRVHVNDLMKISNPDTGEQKYNFHIKESVRGFEGKADLKNKVRVWTFCGSKGCEADVVIVFGFDIFFGRPHGLNQVGVALSRAKKRLLVMHGKQFDQESREYIPLPYYPLLGDSENGINRHTVCVVVDGGPTANCSIHTKKEDKIVVDIPSIGDGGKTIEEVYSSRSNKARNMLIRLAQCGTIAVDIGIGRIGPSMDLPMAPDKIKRKELQEIYVASNFSYFSASSETKFLEYGTWTTIADGAGGNDTGSSNNTHINTDGRIPYKTDVHFTTTKEDVSALYGEAVTYMLQWETYKFVPNIEPILFDGILKLDANYQHTEKDIRWELKNMNCEPLTPKDEKIFREEFHRYNNKMNGQTLVKFMNDRLNIKKKRKKIINHDDGATTKLKNRIGQDSSDGYNDDNDNNNRNVDDGKSGDNWITFSIKIMEAKQNDDDKLLEGFIPQMQDVYNLVDKEPHQWIYLANGVMAFSNFHEKFRQIGTEPDSYKSWVNASALRTGLDRLKGIMKRILPSLSANDNTHDTRDDMTKFGTFERELDHEFARCDIITEAGNGRHVVGVGGICDWINDDSLSMEGILHRKNGKDEFDVDLLEIKFVHQLCNLHRLQLLVYCALYALEMMDKNEEAKTEDELTNDRDKKEYRAECRGMLYNARTGEIEICSIESNKAQQFLLDISQFKYNGIEHHQKQQQVPSKECKKETKTVSDVACYGSSQDASLSSSSWQSKGPSKKRFQKAANAANHDTIDRNWPKRPKREQDQTTLNNVAGTSDDPIILD